MSDNRVSMNTSLKDARIFDEDSWEAEQICHKLTIKTEPEEEAEDDNAEYEFRVNAEQRECLHFESDFIAEQRKVDFAFSASKNKQKPVENLLSLKFECKQEPVGSSTIDFHIKHEKESDENTNDSTDSANNLSRKSSKKSVFKREAPYLRREMNTVETPYQKSKTLYPSSNSEKNRENIKKRRYEYESDPEVLSRRQKQIDFGKNTIGYDNYVKVVARHERTAEDPVTPNKYMKYSRRAWDGLIKQWRLKLHKFDPPDN